ncbi:sigma-54 dependent transcriptional regulator [Kiloniella laminariae]|uniref:Sigma-54 dependent transcriptional regulator n=1 Tax=Kiloniella laminariae TaxID=454162 RepID=A0ABT4LHF3_9PROT|nr:sigma-54 dependent transcriptional regulator [Kiloniella laminariae]MCZ4280528.1 sigma-54 dependent transcriptional regulator [Kiloniella laminariae]
MRLLIVGSLEGHMITAGKIAFERGAKVATVDDINQAMSSLRTGQGADLLLVDIDLDIDTLCKNLLAERFSVPVIACGIGTQPSKAGDAIRSGAKEYIPLPPDAELIAAVLAAVTEETTALVFKDPATAAVLRLAEQIAPSDASVLVTGESGTGKEVMSRYLHSKSKRAKNHFISVNCAAIPENLLESELFGHEKGAFTGAIARRIGKFEEANGGTLLLDEISEMHPRLQAKLLRAVQEREIDRVGGTQPIKVDIRLLATSNRNLEEEVKKGNFREDLYYRLNVVNIEMPALRERPLDIEILAEHFIGKYAKSNGIAKPALTPEAKHQLLQHHWRGNVRELENTMHRAVLLSRDNLISPEAIMLTGSATFGPTPIATPSVPPAVPPAIPGYPAPGKAVASSQPMSGAEASGGAMVGRTVADVERDLILNTLDHCLGNRTHAANILGISIRTLRNKLKLYSEDGIEITGPGGNDSLSPSL